MRDIAICTIKSLDCPKCPPIKGGGASRLSWSEKDMTVRVCPDCGAEWEDEPTFTRDQIKKMSPEEYEEKRAAIIKAMTEGRIK